MKKDKKGLEKSTFMEIPAIMRSVTTQSFVRYRDHKNFK